MNFFKNISFSLFIALYGLSTNAQIIAYFDLGAYNVPAQRPFIETHLTLVGSSLAKKKVNGQLQNSVNITALIKKDTNVISANKYNLAGPLFTDSAKAPAFIDVQRYPLANGIYTLALVITDNVNKNQKPQEFVQKFAIGFSDSRIEGSSIEILESFKKAEATTLVTKSGFDLVPYNVNYFPESQNSLAFYFEAYNTDTVLGSNKPFVFSYYIETADRFQKLDNFGAFKKQTSARVNPLIAKFDITNLRTGNYNLVIEVKDEKNTIQLQSKYFFQRLNKTADMMLAYELNQKKTVAEYFGACNNLDTLKMFVECLWPIANGLDKERVINQSLTKNADLMKKFVIDFWERRAGDSVNPLRLWGAYYQEVQKAMALFKCGKQPGYYTERGRVYLQYGPPNQRAQQNMDLNTYPYEIWQYYRIEDKTNNTFYTNKKFVFVNQNLADDCHRLVHSDMRGEIYNDRWSFELSRNKYGDPNQTKPQGSEYNRYDDLYSNPR